MDPIRQFWQLHIEHSRLDRIKAAVVSEGCVEITLWHAMHSKLAHGLGERSIVCGDSTAITGSTEIFCGKKAEAAHITKAAHRLSIPGGAGCLGAVFDHF